MSSFTTPLLVRIEQGERAGRGLAMIEDPFAYDVGALGSGDRIIVPVGFETDFCSIPRLLMPFFPVLGVAAKAAVIHDFLLRQHVRPRAECDDIFLEAMGVLKVPLVRRYVMWAGVRLWGIVRR